MSKQILTTMLILLTVVVYAAGVYADNTVLEIVPKDSTGFIYMGNPMRLSQKIDRLASDMTDTPQHNLLAKVLADAFGANFQSLDDLQNTGFDLEQDLCILFYDDVSEEEIAVIAHVHDPNGVTALLQSETGPMEKYEIFEDLFITGSEEICQKVADTRKNKNNSVLKSSKFKSLKIDLSDKNEIAFFVNIDKIVQTHSAELQELNNEAKSALEELDPEMTTEGSEMMAKLGLNLGLWIVDQLDLYCMTANLDGSLVQFTEFVKFKDESEIQKYISTEPTELNLLKFLPHGSFIVGSSVYKKEDWIGIFKIFFDITQEENVEVDPQAFEQLAEGLENFYGHFKEEFAFAADISSSMIPDMLYVFETKDDKSAKEYMKTGYLEYLKLVSDNSIGLPTSMVGMNALADATLGETENYYDVEIQNINLPNMANAFANMPQEIDPLIPKNWSIWYAIKDGKMIMAMSSSSEPVKQALDTMNGDAGNIESDRNYDELSRSFAAKNNCVGYFSLVMLSKKIAMLVSQTNPDVGAMVAMMFGNLPETYNIAASCNNRDKGVEANIVIALDDIKQVVQMLIALSQQ